jgi:hypothetical protein
VTQATGGKGAFHRIGGPQVASVCRWEVVEGEPGIKILLENPADLSVRCPRTLPLRIHIR